jgi:hypothetical protein
MGERLLMGGEVSGGSDENILKLPSGDYCAIFEYAKNL